MAYTTNGNDAQREENCILGKRTFKGMDSLIEIKNVEDVKAFLEAMRLEGKVELKPEEEATNETKA